MSARDLTPRDAPPADAAAFQAIVAEFRPALIGYFSRRVRAQSEIEDLVHDVLVRLVRIDSLNGADHVRGYVFRTANSVLVDWLRKRETHCIPQHLPFDPLQHGDEDFPPERVLLGREGLMRATAILLELPERTRAVFLLRRLEGMKYADIATRLGISLSTVEKNMGRAIAHLTERMNEP